MRTRLVVTIAIVVIGLITLFTTCGYERIDSGHAGVMVELFGSNKGVQDVTAITGGNFYNKWTQEIHEFPTFVQHVTWTKNQNAEQINEELSVTAKGGATLNFDVGFDYQVIPERVPSIFQTYRKDLPTITQEFLRTAVRNSYNDIAGQITADSILSNRHGYDMAVKKDLATKLKSDFIISQVAIIGKIRYDNKGLEDAINRKITAIQDAQTKQNEKQSTIAEAQKQMEKAKGDSISLMISTNAKARALRTNADAEAYANQKISSSITSTLIEWQKANSWNGELPTYVGGGSPIMSMPK